MKKIEKQEIIEKQENQILEERQEVTVSEESLTQSPSADVSVESEITVNVSDAEKEKKKGERKKQFLEVLKFTGFSISAGVIQLCSFELLYDLIKWKVWWPCYLISIVLSVIWNFTFNRKFTFKSASNVPLAMTFALLFYVAFIPVSTFGGDALKNAGWNGTLVTALMMVINFATEFVWDKFVVFNDKFMNMLLHKLKRKKTNLDEIEVSVLDETGEIIEVEGEDKIANNETTTIEPQDETLKIEEVKKS